MLLKNSVSQAIQRSLKMATRASSASVIIILSAQLDVLAAESVSQGAKNRFDISQQRADESLIEFAKQADITVIFPFTKVKVSTANELKGRFSIKQGVDILLANTGLTAKFDSKGTLIIELLSSHKTPKEDDNVFSKIKRFFTEEKNRMVTFPTPKAEDVELITVRGIRESVLHSMDVKRSSRGVTDVIQAIDIGKFPDQNLAESLQRITGVSIDRSEGEGQFVTVRGFGPQFNAVLTNGRRLATDNLGREFSFDTLASELVSGVKVHKTNSAALQSGGIGSTIDIKTAKPLDFKGFKIAGSLKALYDTNSEESTPQASALVSHTFNDEKLGFLLSVAHQKRKSRMNEVRTDGWLLNPSVPQTQIHTNAPSIFVPRNYDQRVRFDKRTRTGGTLVLQYHPNNDIQVDLDYLVSRFDVETDSTSMGHWFTSSNLENVVTDENGTAVKFEQHRGHATDFQARTFDRPSQVKALGLKTKWQASDNLALNFDLSISEASLKDRDGSGNEMSIIGYLNRSRFDHSEGNILPHISGFADAAPSILDADGNVSGVAHYLDPINGRAHVMLRRGWNIKDDLNQFRIDGTWDGGLKYISNIQFGGLNTHQRKQNQRRDNEANLRHCRFCGYGNTPEIPNDFQTVFDAGDDFLAGLSGSAGIPTMWLRHDGEQLFSFLEDVSGASFDAVSRDNSFIVEEKVSAAYIQSEHEFEYDDILISAQLGIRYEDTQIGVSGLESELIELTILDQTELGQITAAKPILFESSYNNWLPSLSVQMDIHEDIVSRFAYSKSLTRPTMSQMSPGLVFNTTRQGGDLRASIGNPLLKPFQSANFDVSVEWYYAPSSLLSISYFAKEVDDFIVSLVENAQFGNVTDPSTGSDINAPDADDEVAQFALTRPTNSETASVNGWEMAIQHDFADSVFGILANMTIVNSNAELDRSDISQKFALTGLSDSQNIIGYYEKGKIQARIAWNHRDGFLQSLVQIQGGEPTFVGSYHQLDISASYDLNNYFSVFFEGINVTNEHVIKHGRYSNHLLLAQDTGARYAVGLRGNF